MEKALDVLDSIKREIITKRFGIRQDRGADGVVSEAHAPKGSCSGSESLNSGEEVSVHKQASSSSKEDSSPKVVVSLKSGYKKPSVPSYRELAQELTANGNPKEILRYATKHENNRLILDEQDIQELEQEALRELARGNRIRYAPRK
jgi:hypothetical protein